MDFLKKHDRWAWLLAAVLMLPALFYNIDLMPLNSDGGLRGLVALEMTYSGDHIVPTNNGDLYYKKPPVFNWLIVATHWITGDYSNATIRFPVGLSLILFGLTVVAFFRKELGTPGAVFTGLMVIAGGHMLFESSRVGRIDITYSWITFTGFMVVYHYHRRGNYWGLFMASYAVAAVGFLTKGLPTVVFQGITLIAWLTVNREFKRLFSIHHIAGGVVFTLIAGAYYLAYELRNPGDLPELIGALWHDSNERTLAHFGAGKIAGHIAAFPVRILYEILPWSFLIICWFRKDLVRKIRETPILRFSAVIFLANIIIYWISPGSNTRYILMFFPLLTATLVYFFQVESVRKQNLNNIVEWIFQALIGVMVIGIWAFLWMEPFNQKADLIAWCAGLSVVFAILAGLYFRFKGARLALMVCAMLVARLAFNGIVKPVLDEEANTVPFRAGAETVAEMTKGEPLLAYGRAVINPEISVYIARIREEILYRKRKEFVNETEYYLIDQKQRKRLEEGGIDWEEHHQFPGDRDHTLYLVTFSNHPSEIVGDPKP